MHWSRLAEAGFDGGIRFLFFVFRWFGRWPFRLALVPVIAWNVLVRRVPRRASREYLARLHAASGGATPAPSLWNVLRHFATFAEALLDKLLVWSGRLDALRWHISDDGATERLLAQGRGAVILINHIGNMELCRVLSRRHAQFAMTVLVHSAHTPNFERLMDQLDPQRHVRLLQVGALDAATAMQLGERVARGEFLAIAGDRIPLAGAGNTVPVDFLGARALLPIGPYVLAHALRCPLLLLTVSRRDDGVHHIDLRQLAETVVLPRASRVAATQALAQRFADELAAECRAAPLQWFNFYPFWNVDAAAAAPPAPESA